jgi:hypothetical protein
MAASTGKCFLVPFWRVLGHQIGPHAARGRPSRSRIGVGLRRAGEDLGNDCEDGAARRRASLGARHQASRTLRNTDLLSSSSSGKSKPAMLGSATRKQRGDHAVVTTDREEVRRASGPVQCYAAGASVLD